MHFIYSLYALHLIYVVCCCIVPLGTNECLPFLRLLCVAHLWSWQLVIFRAYKLCAMIETGLLNGATYLASIHACNFLRTNRSFVNQVKVWKRSKRMKKNKCIEKRTEKRKALLTMQAHSDVTLLKLFFNQNESVTNASVSYKESKRLTSVYYECEARIAQQH